MEPVLGEDLRGVGGHEEDALTRAMGEELLGELHAVGFGHHHVEQDQVDGPLRDPEDVQRLLRAIRLQDPQAKLSQHPGSHMAGDALVVHDEYGDV